MEGTLQNNTFKFKPRFIIRRLIFILIFGGIFVHVIGLFGILIGLAYPLVWMIFPNWLICFYSLRKIVLHGGGYCTVCGEGVIDIYPHNFRSMLINAATLILASFLFMPIIIIEAGLLTNWEFNLKSISPAQETSFIIPDKKFVSSTEYLYFDIEIRNLGKPINFIQADLKFPADLVEATEIKTDNSVATIFVQKEFSNEEGTITIAGGLPNPGFSGERGIFARIWFKPKRKGAGEIKFAETSKILKNDGFGTNLLYKFEAMPIIID